MQKLPGILCLLAVLAGCTDPAPSTSKTSETADSTEIFEPNSPAARQALSAPAQTLRGMYRTEARGAFFFDCVDGKNYRVGAKPPGLDSLYREVCQPAPYPGEPVFAVLQGKFSRIGAGEDLLLITQIDTLAARTMYNSCQPYEFWCVGTEPFWGMVISKSEGIISLKQIGETNGKAFPWVKPEQSGGAMVYRTTHAKTGEKLTVTVRREACTDGMSERQYSHVVRVQLGAKTLTGCAVE